jgi:hypothetical protein
MLPRGAVFTKPHLDGHALTLMQEAPQGYTPPT